MGCEPPQDDLSSDAPAQAEVAAQAEQKPSTQPQSQPVAKLSPELSKIFALIRARQTGPARVQLRKHLKLHPDDGHAHFLFGLTYHREQKYAQALPHFEEGLRLAPDYYLVHHFKGWALYYLGDLDAARVAFHTYLQSQPDHPDTLFALGLIDLDEDNLDQAQQRFQRSIDLLIDQGEAADPRDISKGRARLAEVYERRGDLERARAELVTSIELYPDQYEAIYKLYRVLVRLGETEQAESVHRQYLEVKERVRPGTSFPE